MNNNLPTAIEHTTALIDSRLRADLSKIAALSHYPEEQRCPVQCRALQETVGRLAAMKLLPPGKMLIEYAEYQSQEHGFSGVDDELRHNTRLIHSGELCQTEIDSLYDQSEHLPPVLKVRYRGLLELFDDEINAYVERRERKERDVTESPQPHTPDVILPEDRSHHTSHAPTPNNMPRTIASSGRRTPQGHAQSPSLRRRVRRRATRTTNGESLEKNSATPVISPVIDGLTEQLRKAGITPPPQGLKVSSVNRRTARTGVRRGKH